MYSDFINRYPVSKTLRFELIPQGKTLEYIERDGVITEGEHRANSYKQVKKIIDEYHKDFIEKALSEVELSNIDNYAALYQKTQKTDKDNLDFQKCEESLRKEICVFFKNQEGWSNLFKKELLTEVLPKFVKDDTSKDLLKEFDGFATYFVGFHENRKNIYSDEAQSTAIAYRLINQNLPKYIDNIAVIDKALNSIDELKEAATELKEILGEKTIVEFFALDNYCSFLTQSGIDNYNQVIGGFLKDETTKIKGLNEYINLYNQQVEKSERIGKLKPLFKQILSDNGTVSFIPDKYKSDQELLDSIKEYVELSKPAKETIGSLLDTLSNYDLNGIYVSTKDNTLQTISQKLFGSWSYIIECLYEEYDRNSNAKNKKSETYLEKRAKAIKSVPSYSLEELSKIVNEELSRYFNGEGKDSIISNIDSTSAALKALLENPYSKEKSLINDADSTALIKAHLDAVKELQHFVAPLLGSTTEPNKDERFYGEFSEAYEVLDHITALYNKTRNYLTAKPYSIEKTKLNFENSTLLDGWDVNKEKDNAAVLLFKDDKYYLGIMSKGNYRLFYNIEPAKTDDVYKKMDYKLLPGPNKMLPKVFLSKRGIKNYKPSEELLKKYAEGTHTKSGNDNFNIKDCRNLIDYFKSSIEKHPDWSTFGFVFSDTSSYQDISGFYREVEDQGYKLSFRTIDSSLIEQFVDEGKLYLFQIYNKDFSPYSKGRPNLHTLYWKMLFDDRNLEKPVYKLNGRAEIFYRKASIKTEDLIVHPAEDRIPNKNLNNEKRESCFEYDIIKDRRFSVDKFQFHVPITMNYQAHGGSYLNEDVRIALKHNTAPYVIGIDRGERNLLYICVIDSKGKIVEQFSLNEIINYYNGNTYSVNYHDLLDQREKDRDEARKNWKTIDSIKELKEGYLSQVIHLLTGLMVKYNAIVVLEDLNVGFMRGRQKVEKQVYQKFEKMLIDKLNYLVDKGAPIDEEGGLLKAYQLSNKFESFQKLGKQSGLLFYTQAWNTSKIDPVTGFANLFDTRYKSVELAKTFWSCFDSITFNEKKGHFEFSFDYSKFTYKAEGSKTSWVVCSYGDRIRSFRNAEKNNQWDSESVELTEAFISLFEDNSIDYKGCNLIDAIVNNNDKTFHQRLLGLFRLTLQLRNSAAGTDIDYIISPVADKEGNFFDSRKGDNRLPVDADANGAFNIARKGLLMIEKIKSSPEDNIGKVNLAISNKEWLKYAQS